MADDGKHPKDPRLLSRVLSSGSGTTCLSWGTWWSVRRMRPMPEFDGGNFLYVREPVVFDGRAVSWVRDEDAVGELRPAAEEGLVLDERFFEWVAAQIEAGKITLTGPDSCSGR